MNTQTLPMPVCAELERHKRILYAEDDDFLRGLMSQVLSHLGWEVTSGPHGGVALDHYDAGKFEVVITDHHMPDTDGLALVQNLRARGFNGRIYVVSGGVSAEQCEQYRDLHVDGIFKKPIAIGDLRAMLGAA